MTGVENGRERRARYASVLFRDPQGVALARPVVWIEWAEATGHRERGPVVGPVALGRASTPALHELEATDLIERWGFVGVGGWHETPRGMVTWVEPALCMAFTTGIAALARPAAPPRAFGDGLSRRPRGRGSRRVLPM